VPYNKGNKKYLIFFNNINQSIARNGVGKIGL